jgi:hypothetical protein
VIQVVNSARSPSAFGSAASSSVCPASSGTSSARSSRTVSTGSRNPTSAWNSVSAQISSGLWLASR